MTSASSELYAVPCFGADQARPREHLAEGTAVLGEVDGARRRADDRHPLVLERLREAERRLAAELHDDAGDRARLALGVDDLEDVLERQRLEVEAAARVVVGRHGLGVAVDHDRVESLVAQGERRVHAGVVELDALPDAVRARAEDDDGRALARLDLGLLVVGAVVVRRRGCELGRARVDGLVDRAHPEGVAHAADHGLRHTPDGGDLGVAEAVALDEPEQVGRQLVGVGEHRRDVVDEGDLVEEPRVDAGGLVHLLDACSRREAPAARGRSGRRSGPWPPRAHARRRPW